MEREEIRQKALYILDNLGIVEDSDYPLNYRGNFSIWCKYEKEGLIIRSDDLKYADRTKEIKKSMKDIEIKYDDRLVYNSRVGIYVPGFWEDLFQALYEKVPKILLDSKLRAELLEKGNIFFQNALFKINYDVKIGNDIEVRNESHEKWDWLDKSWKQRSVFYKEKLVLKAFQREDDETMGVVEYVPGEWETEILEYIQKLEESRRESQKRLEKLRLARIKNI